MKKTQISFSTVIRTDKYFTTLDFKEDLIEVYKQNSSKDKREELFTGTLEEFILLEKQKVGAYTDQVYHSILEMAVSLSDMVREQIHDR